MALVVATTSESSPAERWVRFDGDTEVLLRSLDDRLYQIGLARVRRQIQQVDSRFKVGEIGIVEGERTEHDYQCRLLSQYILKGWRGAKDGSGADVKYSPEAGEATLRSNIEFFLFVIKQAGEIAAEVEKERADTLGKSSPATDGSSSASA